MLKQKMNCNGGMTNTCVSFGYLRRLTSFVFLENVRLLLYLQAYSERIPTQIVASGHDYRDGRQHRVSHLSVNWMRAFPGVKHELKMMYSDTEGRYEVIRHVNF
jgi:hypothetical protein